MKKDAIITAITVITATVLMFIFRDIPVLKSYNLHLLPCLVALIIVGILERKLRI